MCQLVPVDSIIKSHELKAMQRAVLSLKMIQGIECQMD